MRAYRARRQGENNRNSAPQKSVVFELMPLSLEEVFIHETAALGYSFDEGQTDETK